MKIISTLCLTLLMTVGAHAQTTMNHASMPGMAHGDMQKTEAPASASVAAVVRSIDPAKGSAMLAHEPVPSMHLPAMTMAFLVKDKAMFSKLTVGKKVTIDFAKQGGDFVITAVK